jgi:hypothetical protein
MTFIGPLMMYSNLFVTVYGALDRVHIFSDFQKSDPVYSPLMSPYPASLDLVLSEVILRDLVWVRMSYVFVYSTDRGLQGRGSLMVSRQDQTFVKLN